MQKLVSNAQNAMLAAVFICLLLAVSLPTGSLEAQQVKKIPRVGYLSALSASAESSRLEGFRRGLSELGYVDGKNIFIEARFADGNLDRLPDFVAELVRLKVGVIVTGGSPGTQAAQQAAGTIPLVMTVVGDPVPRFVASLAKPGGNITGLTQVSRELSGKRLELLKETFPKISRVAVFDDAALTAQVKAGPLQETRTAAEAFGIKLQFFEIGGANPDLEGRFRTVTNHRSEALVILPGPSLVVHRKRFVELAAKNRLPAIYPSNEFVEDGGLMSYGVDHGDLCRRAAVYVDKILKGTKPADLPVEQPTKFELIINLKAAKQTGLTIPQSVLYKADKVIK
jgi:putative ABC transport system substrate-binding protein